ncbi:MAG: MFS transporter [Rickettsiales bacterium]|nr:MFS transporter [Rickettsiales bacterium]
MNHALTRTQLMQYAFLAVPVAFAGFPLYVLAPDFYATHHGVSLSVLGIVLLGLRAFDAVQDPFIGAMSDRFSVRALPIMLGSALLLVASIYALFNPVGLSPSWWFAGCMLLAVTVYSILSINLNTLGALWTSNRNEQTRIAGTREAFGLFGLLLAVIMPGILGKYLPAEKVFIWFSTILGVLMIVALLTFSRWFAHKPQANRTPHSQKKIWVTLRLLPAATHRLYMVYGLSVLASSIPAVLVVFFIRDRLNAESYTGIFLLLYFLSGALAMPMWKKLSAKYGKHCAWLMSILLAVASFVWAFFLGAGDVWQYAMICITSGMALGGDLALPPSILADHIHEHESDSSAATQFSILALLTKAGLAIGSAITLPLLDAVGFVPATQNADTALTSLSTAYALIPCLIKLSAAYLLYHFFITSHREKNHETSLETHLHRSRPHA